MTLFRFKMYSIWFNTKKYPTYTLIRAYAHADTKKLLQRLTGENAKDLGRALSKIIHMHPDIVFNQAMYRVRSYLNFVQPVVDSVKYNTNLGHDVLNCMFFFLPYCVCFFA